MKGEGASSRQIIAIRKIKSTRKKNIYIYIYIFISFFRISKTYSFTLGSLSIKGGHVKHILHDIKQCK